VGHAMALRQKLNGGVYLPYGLPLPRGEEKTNSLLRGYPGNHNYAVVPARLVPSRRLERRLRVIQKSYPGRMESFLDIGCCRGFFVLEAARRPTCRIAVGIDVHPPFVSTAERVRQHLGLANAAFHLASLQEVADQPEAYGGPFQTVLFVGAYHYLFWGSTICTTAWHSHREILRRVARLCTERCIFSARLEFDTLPDATRMIARDHPARAQYTTKDFLESAEEFFHVHQSGFLGAYPLLILSRNGDNR
jgi:SAM-dependent methyltransferase